MSPRISHLIETGDAALPAAGDIVVFGADASVDLSVLPKPQVLVICRTQPDHDRLQAAGFRVAEAAPKQAAAAVVVVPRAKAQARALVAQALATAAMVIVDGQKTDGIDGLLREMRRRTDCSFPYSKAHGKAFVARPPGHEHAFDDWTAAGAPKRNADGFVTVAGAFSADAIDPASRLLATALPGRLGRHVADFGAGWGFLATEILKREGVELLDLVEADNAALDCARSNVTDPRARFYWADACNWRPAAPLDTVVMNPPFHEGRRGVPQLGQAFIANAAACLAPGGRLLMVANRHLPYEATLGDCFREVEEIGGDGRFKLFLAARPSRPRR